MSVRARQAHRNSCWIASERPQSQKMPGAQGLLLIPVPWPLPFAWNYPPAHAICSFCCTVFCGFQVVLRNPSPSFTAFFAANSLPWIAGEGIASAVQNPIGERLTFRTHPLSEPLKPRTHRIGRHLRLSKAQPGQRFETFLHLPCLSERIPSCRALPGRLAMLRTTRWRISK
jgi:hypothetical protein